MLAVHFGAGNIGRGFIGQILHNAGYEICFIDVNEEIINELNKRRSYKIGIADPSQEIIEITNVRGINSAKNPEEVLKAVRQANLITTAVGPNILPHIAKAIAEGLAHSQKESMKNLNIIACENMINGSDALRDGILSHLDSDMKNFIKENVGFPNAAVDRIVPIQSHEDKLFVTVEPFYEWVVNKTEIRGEMPNIDGITYVDELLPYIERKLFTVNTGHAAAAYLGSYYGLPTVLEAITDSRVREFVEDLLSETGTLLQKKYGFDANENQTYIKKILSRFENKYIVDEVSRVARTPIRKIGANERFVKPARELLDFGVNPTYLAQGIALAMMYKNNEDSEAVELQDFIAKNSVEVALEKYAGLPADSPLTFLIKDAYSEMQK